MTKKKLPKNAVNKDDFNFKYANEEHFNYHLKKHIKTKKLQTSPHESALVNLIVRCDTNFRNQKQNLLKHQTTNFVISFTSA